MDITLKGEKPTSWNVIYSGKGGWRRRSKEANRVHDLVISAVQQKYGEFEPYTNPVHITITFATNDGRLVKDPCNIPAKLYIDGLVRSGVITDDSHKFVSAVTTRRVVAKTTYVLIEIKEQTYGNTTSSIEPG